MSNEFTQKVCAFDLIIEMKLKSFLVTLLFYELFVLFGLGTKKQQTFIDFNKNLVKLLDWKL